MRKRERPQQEEVGLSVTELALRLDRAQLEAFFVSRYSGEPLPPLQTMVDLLPERMRQKKPKQVEVASGTKPINAGAADNVGYFAGFPTDLLVKIVAGETDTELARGPAMPFRSTFRFLTSVCKAFRVFLNDSRFFPRVFCSPKMEDLIKVAPGILGCLELHLRKGQGYIDTALAKKILELPWTSVRSLHIDGGKFGKQFVNSVPKFRVISPQLDHLDVDEETVLCAIVRSAPQVKSIRMPRSAAALCAREIIEARGGRPVVERLSFKDEYAWSFMRETGWPVLQSLGVDYPELLHLDLSIRADPTLGVDVGLLNFVPNLRLSSLAIAVRSDSLCMGVNSLIAKLAEFAPNLRNLKLSIYLEDAHFNNARQLQNHVPPSGTVSLAGLSLLPLVSLSITMFHPCFTLCESSFAGLQHLREIRISLFTDASAPSLLSSCQKIAIDSSVVVKPKKVFPHGWRFEDL